MPVYASISDIKADLNIIDAAQDSYITALELDVQETINDYCKVDTFHAITGKVDTFYEFNNRLVLKNHPVSSVTSIICDPNGTNPQTLSTDSYRLETEKLDTADSSPKSYTGFVKNLSSWFKEPNGIDVTYDYGYSTIPLQIKRATIYTCVQWYHQMRNTNAHKSFGLSSVVKGEETFDFSGLNKLIPDQAKMLLMDFRRLR